MKNIVLLMIFLTSVSIGTILAQSPDVRVPITPADATQLTILAELKNNNVMGDSIAFSADTHYLAVAGFNGTVILWDMTTGDKPTVLRGVDFIANILAFSPDGKTLAVGTEKGKVELWDIQTAHKKQDLTGHSQTITGLAFSPDNTWLTSTDTAGVIRVWDAATGTESRVLEGYEYSGGTLRFSSDSSSLFYAGERGGLKVWNIATGEPDSDVQEAYVELANTVTLSSDEKLLAFGGLDGAIQLWDIASGHESTLLKEHSNIVTDLAFNPDHTLLASYAVDFSLRVWDVKTGKSLSHFDELYSVRSLTFSSDGTLLAVAQEGSVFFVGIQTEHSLFPSTATPTVASTIPTPTDTTNEDSGSTDCKLVCLPSADGLDVNISCETGEVTRSVNNSTSVSYDAQGGQIATLKLNETRTYAVTGHAYHIKGEIVFKQTSFGSSLSSYSLEATGDGFDEEVMCKG